MDVSQKTAEALAFRHLGTARVKLEYLGQASLAGSDDKLLLATLRTDGQPAAIPGTSARTMVASFRPGRNRALAERRSRRRAARAGARSSARRSGLCPRAPAAQAASGFSTASDSSRPSSRPCRPQRRTAGGVPVRGVKLPPSRPFDLDTIANAATPVVVPAAIRTTLPPSRSTVASLFAAPDRAPTERSPPRIR